VLRTEVHIFRRSFKTTGSGTWLQIIFILLSALWKLYSDISRGFAIVPRGIALTNLSKNIEMRHPLLWIRSCGILCFWTSRIRIRHYLYGSGSFHHQAKTARKILISTVLRLPYDFQSLKNDVKIQVVSKKTWEKKKICGHLEGHWRKEQDSLVRGTDPRIHIRTTMSRIHNTGALHLKFIFVS
jgi:hypothetical protein